MSEPDYSAKAAALLASGVNLGRLEAVERRALQHLKKAKLDPSQPPPHGTDEISAGAWLALWYVNHVRELVVADRYDEAGQAALKAYSFSDNADFGALLREKERRSKSVVTDANILAAVDQHATQADAAADLGMTDRQLRTRLNRIKRKS